MLFRKLSCNPPMSGGRFRQKAKPHGLSPLLEPPDEPGARPLDFFFFFFSAIGAAQHPSGT